jgi:hypothetical protein
MVIAANELMAAAIILHKTWVFSPKFQIDINLTGKVL